MERTGNRGATVSPGHAANTIRAEVFVPVSKMNSDSGLPGAWSQFCCEPSSTPRQIRPRSVVPRARIKSRSDFGKAISGLIN